MDTAVLLYAPVLDPLAARWRTSTAAAPPHLVLADPFVPSEQLDEGVVEELRWFFAGVDGLTVRFAAVQRHEGVLWLTPVEQQDVADLSEALTRRWPQEGVRPVHRPSLPIAEGDAVALDIVEAELAPQLPLAATLTGAGLWVREGEGWLERARFPLGQVDPQGGSDT